MATGTIKSTNTAGAVLISELRTSGPGGAGDDFVEIYNNSNSPLTVAAPTPQQDTDFTRWVRTATRHRSSSALFRMAR